LAGDARVAFYVCLNIEHMPHRQPIDEHLGGHASLVPDPLNYGWRDYGPRIAIWRLIESLDRHGIRASALVNSEGAPRYPQTIEAGPARGWAWFTHGGTNSRLQTCMTAEQERVGPTEVVASD
jgi:allantoinase